MSLGREEKMGRAFFNFISESLLLLLVFCSDIAFINFVYPHNTVEKLYNKSDLICNNVYYPSCGV